LLLLLISHLEDHFVDIPNGEFIGLHRFYYVVYPIGLRFQLRPNKLGKPEDFRSCVVKGSR
jgi:hypothetical protein